MSERGKISESFDDIVFSSKFDSGNLDKVEECVASLGVGTREFNLWTAPDCAGEPWESGCRSWFYFSATIPTNMPGLIVRLNIQNLNKQCRLYQQGLTPIIKTVPGRGNWERLRDRIKYEPNEEGVHILSFQLTVPDSRKHTFYCAFCFPHSYTECQKVLTKIDEQFSGAVDESDENSIYYQRELVCRSLEGRRVDLITISSYHGIESEREPRLKKLFPDTARKRAHVFTGKKVIFVSSRVHPGETPSSHVFNGLLHFILRRDDPRAQALRKHFVLKLIPMLNPDGVSRGHYRMNITGVNLNRVYLDPDFEQYPSIFAAHSLILHHHNKGTLLTSYSSKMSTPEAQQVKPNTEVESQSSFVSSAATSSSVPSTLTSTASEHTLIPSTPPQDAMAVTRNSGLAFYVDLHAHASKRGCFFYGNYFSDLSEQTENMLLPRLMSLNSPHVDFDHCVFSEKNMYTADKRDGMSKEGSGRVAMYKTTGHIHCYTLECNYNSGRLVNNVEAATLTDGSVTPPHLGSPMAHRFSIRDFEEVGRALAVSALDLYQLNPCTRLPNTQFKCLAGLRESLQQRVSATRAKRAKQFSAKRSGKSIGRDKLEKVSPSFSTKESTQAAKLVILKKQQALGLSKGAASIAYDIAFVTESKRNGRRAQPLKSGSRRRGSNEQQTSKATPATNKAAPAIHSELSIPSAVKVHPSVQDVVFPLSSRRGSAPSIRVANKPLSVEATDHSHRSNHFPTSASLRVKPFLGKNLRRSKTEPLPAISDVKYDVSLPVTPKAKLNLSKSSSLSLPHKEPKVLGDSSQPCVDKQTSNSTTTTS